MRIWMMLGLLLAGCDSHVVPTNEPKVEKQSQDTVFDTQRSALQ